jgi:hypothetical protein
MNKYQELWWQQSESDHAAFQLLRGHGPGVCHTLHYLQMTTEKLAKASGVQATHQRNHTSGSSISCDFWGIFETKSIKSKSQNYLNSADSLIFRTG